jgi:hypothetical protein
VVRVKGFAELHTLFLIGNDRITDSGLVHLKRLTFARENNDPLS